MMGICAGMTEVHVVPNGHGWTIEAAGTLRDDLKTQVEAILVGCRLAAEQGGEVVVHAAVAGPQDD
jgi:hypothetical protein